MPSSIAIGCRSRRSKSNASIGEKEVKLHGERYRVLVVPPVEVIPYGTLAKAKAFFDAGGVVVGYGFLPSKSATIGKTGAEIASLCARHLGRATRSPARPRARPTRPAAGRICSRKRRRPTEVTRALADAGVHPTLEVLDGKTDGWLHVLHRVKDGRDVLFVANQNHLGARANVQVPRHRRGRAGIMGSNAQRNHRDSLPTGRRPAGGVLARLWSRWRRRCWFSSRRDRPARCESNPARSWSTSRLPIARDPNPPIKPLGAAAERPSRNA